MAGKSKAPGRGTSQRDMRKIVKSVKAEPERRRKEAIRKSPLRGETKITSIRG